MLAETRSVSYSTITDEENLARTEFELKQLSLIPHRDHTIHCTAHGQNGLQLNCMPTKADRLYAEFRGSFTIKQLYPRTAWNIENTNKSEGLKPRNEYDRLVRRGDNTYPQFGGTIIVKQ